MHYDEGDVVSGLLPSEEVADMRQRMEEMEAEVERLHSVLQCVCFVCMCACVCVPTCVCAYFSLR